MKIIQNSKFKKLIANSSKLKTNSGFTLLFASLVGALVLAVGLAILNIALKQLQLSSAGRESQKAFFSADTGVECALFLDRGGVNTTSCRLGYFGTPTADGDVTVCGEAFGPTYVYECFGKVINIEVGGYVGSGAPYVLNHFELNDLNSQGNGGGDNYNMCFSVDVKKVIDDPSTADEDETATIIESRGYNTCNRDATNRYERAIRTVNF